jgi:hypothetical protein
MTDLRQQIEAILTHNAGRIPERLEQDLDKLEQLFTTRLLALKSELPKPKNTEFEKTLKVIGWDEQYCNGFNAVLEQVTAIIDRQLQNSNSSKVKTVNADGTWSWQLPPNSNSKVKGE